MKAAWDFEVVRGDELDRGARELLNSGLPVPLDYVFVEPTDRESHELILLRESDTGACIGGVGLEIMASSDNVFNVL